MPETTVYQLPFEQYPADQPGITLTGGNPPSSPILAQAVEDELVRIEGTVISNIDARLTIAEAAAAASKWRHIGRGLEAGAAFDIPVPAGFEILKLHLFGDLDGAGTVRLRLNGDATAGLHNTNFVSRRGDTGALVDATFSAAATAWFLANWGTVSGNTVEATIYCPNASGAPVYRSLGERYGSPGFGIESRCWGNLDADRTVTSLNIRPFSDNANLFATCHWWLEGRLV